MARTILIIGIGAGDPDYLTLQAVAALRRVDVFFMPGKGEEKRALNRLRSTLCERHIPDRPYRTVDFAVPERIVSDTDYQASIADWRARVEAEYRRLFAEALAEGECGGFLVWGDPTLYDGTLRILTEMQAAGAELEIEVIPGISAVQALVVRHRIPLNRVGGSVLITTGRRIATALPAADDIVVMLDSEMRFTRYVDEPIDIYWGAYLGTEDELLVAGPLAEVAEKIAHLRHAARARHGWVMDTYLLRRRVE